MIDGGSSRVPGALCVRDVLEWADFPIELVAGAAGLDRRVRWAHPSELIDPSPYLRGGEIILTVGLAMRTDADCAAFVQALAGSDAAAIGLATGVAGQEPPQALAGYAESHGLPLFTVPPTLPFVAFTEKLAVLQTRHRERMRQRAEDGRLLNFIRRDLATPWVLQDRHGFENALTVFGTICLPAEVPARVEGASIIGVLEDRTTIVAEAEAITALAASLQTPVYGLGGPQRLANLAQSLKACAAAFAMSVEAGEPRTPRDLASFTGLVQRLSAEEFAPFHDHIWAPLRAHEARHGTPLVQTLQEFLDCDASLVETARRLYLHVNSVRHRLARVQEVTGLDPMNVRDRLALALAVESGRR